MTKINTTLTAILIKFDFYSIIAILQIMCAIELKQNTLGEQKRRTLNSKNKGEFLFGKRNYKFMFIGLSIIVLGFILMSGGGQDDPNVFNEAIFHWRRIRLAPALVLLGFGIQIYAILTRKEDKVTKKED